MLRGHSLWLWLSFKKHISLSAWLRYISSPSALPSGASCEIIPPVSAPIRSHSQVRLPLAMDFRKTSRSFSTAWL